MHDLITKYLALKTRLTNFCCCGGGVAQDAMRTRHAVWAQSWLEVYICVQGFMVGFVCLQKSPLGSFAPLYSLFCKWVPLGPLASLTGCTVNTSGSLLLLWSLDLWVSTSGSLLLLWPLVLWVSIPGSFCSFDPWSCTSGSFCCSWPLVSTSGSFCSSWPLILWVVPLGLFGWWS